MSAFSGEKVLAELLGFATLWASSWWKRLPQIHLDDTSNTETSLGGLRKSTFFRIGAAVALVLFQVLLVGADVNSRWAIPLVALGIFALSRLTNEFDLTKPQSYTLLSPTSWVAPKIDTREPMVLFPVFSAVASLLLLSTDFSSIHSAWLGFMLLTSGIGFFALLSRATRTIGDEPEESTPSESQAFLRSISAFASGASFLLLVLVASGLIRNFNVLIVLEVLFRAAQAFGLILFASENALAASSAVTAAGIAAAILQDPSSTPGIQALLAFSGALVQTVLAAPKANGKRVILFVLLFVPGLFLPLMSNISLASSTFKESTKEAATEPLKDLPKIVPTHIHPVERLHKKWLADFEKKLARQSKTIEEAVNEYKRRYQRQPPPGFDKWFQFAKEKNYLLLDEFDTLTNSIEPFWRVTPRDILTRSQSALKNGDSFAEIEIVNNQVGRRSWDHWYTDSIVKWFEKFGYLGIVPDFNFTFNAFDEARVVFDPTRMGGRQPLDENGKAPKIDENVVTWLDIGHHPTFSEIGPYCPNQGKPEIDDESAYLYSSNGINFLDASGSTQDVCVSKSLREKHGFFAAPTTMKLTHHVVPIFSQAAPRRYNDILYPTPFYYSSAEDDVRENRNDPPWDAKYNQTYWAGGSTGGESSVENWKDIHRVRVALMTQSKSTAPVTLLRRSELGWKSFQSWWGAISKYFSINITRLVQCEEKACDQMKTKFNLVEQPGNSSLSYKYVLDIDGNSYTGRYYRLLRSSSCVIKSTVFQEWHDDILTPWVHYIPLSNGAQEFGEMVRFLINEPEGDDIGRIIGQSGKDWANRALRREDMEVYALRVFMEYGRLFDEDRDTNGFHLETDRQE